MEPPPLTLEEHAEFVARFPPCPASSPSMTGWKIWQLRSPTGVLRLPPDMQAAGDPRSENQRWIGPDESEVELTLTDGMSGLIVSPGTAELIRDEPATCAGAFAGLPALILRFALFSQVENKTTYVADVDGLVGLGIGVQAGVASCSRERRELLLAALAAAQIESE